MMACRKRSLRHVAAVLAAGVADVSSPSTPTRADDDNRIFVVQRVLGRVSGVRVHGLLSPRQLTSHALCEASARTESERFERAIAFHRSKITTYRKKWEYSANSSATTATKTPSRSWPDVPPDDDLSFLSEDVKYCDRSPNFRSDKDYCARLRFRVASALLAQFDDSSQKTGLKMLRTLAENNYGDAMVFYGMCVNDGRAAMEPNAEEAVSWFKRCSEIGHPQGQYELGVAFYMGEGVAEDEEEAVRQFKLAAEQQHPAASYMLGDCLLDGVGAEVDRAAALGWLVKAAELGHRGARSRVMAVLEKTDGDDYGIFTDASRQTLVEHITPTKLLRDKSSGSRDPTDLARRQTIVSNSRKE